MKNRNDNLSKMYEGVMNGFSSQPYVPGNWPMENGVYKQYSAFEKTNNSVGGTSYND